MRVAITDIINNNLPQIITQEQIDSVVFTDPGIQRYVRWPEVSSVGYESGNFTRNNRIRNRQNILDAFACSLMRSGAKTGKKSKVFTAILSVFADFQNRGLNPYQVLITVIERLLIHEVPYRTKIAGSNVNKSAEAAPTRKLDNAIKLIGLEIHKRSMRTSNSFEEVISRTLLEVYNYSKGPLPNIMKKVEEQRQIAKAAR